MTVVNLVAMAKDLDIHEHTDFHLTGQSCSSTVYECVAKTRIWQLLYVLEGMIGGPQGLYIWLPQSIKADTSQAVQI
jgi:hypothetical protein